MGHDLQQFVQAPGVLGEKVPEALHELVEVRLLADLALFEHPVQSGQHVLHSQHVLAGHAPHVADHLVDGLLHQVLP